MLSCIQVDPGWIELVPPQCQRRARALLVGQLAAAARTGPPALLIRLVLHGPQGTQGGDLGLGQALDARDSEPLVGPVAAQRAQSMASLEVPEPDRSVLAATGEPAAIGTDLEPMYDPLMRFSHPHARAARQVPPAQSTVTASTDQQLPDRVPGDGIDRPHQPLQGGQALPAAGIPHDELPAVLASTPGGQLRAIGAPGHTDGGPLMPRQPLEQPATRGVPHIDLPIFAPARQARAIGTPGQAPQDGVGAAAVADDLHAAARCRAPQPATHT